MRNHAVLFCACALLCSARPSHADQVTVLGSASTYAVLANSTITNSGTSVIHGDLGLYSGSSVTGLLPTDVHGGFHLTDAPAQAAQADAQAAFTYLGGLAVTQDLTGQDLAGQTLRPGVYFFTTTAALSGALTLDFQNLNDAYIVFLIGTSFNTSGASAVTVINQGVNDNVYYRVGTSATLGSASSLSGALLAGASISFGSGATMPCGSAIALSGAVTMLGNTVNQCSATGGNVTPFAPQPGAVPEPSSLALLGTGALSVVGFLRRRRSA